MPQEWGRWRAQSQQGNQDPAERERGAAKVRKATQKPAETCGQVVLEQKLPSTPCTHVALRCFWGGTVGGQEGDSTGQIMGWPLAEQVDFTKPQRSPIVDGSLG